MSKKKQSNNRIHPRNKHQGQYDFKKLNRVTPELAHYVHLNEYGNESIDFFNPAAVKTLNRALLKHYYGIKHWDIPDGYLCPPIPGRADYVHHLADLLAESQPEANKGEIPTGSKVRCLDIGVGANCVYPLIGNKEYGWSFVGSDIDPVSVESANKIVKSNAGLQEQIKIRMQNNSRDIFRRIILKDDKYDLSFCNPPFYGSLAEAEAATVRKVSNLVGRPLEKAISNFGGQNNELWCEGGGNKFVRDLIFQSKHYSQSCLWFSTLISQKSNLKNAHKALKKAKTADHRVITMAQGNKTSRIVVWTYFKPEERLEWAQSRWSADQAKADVESDNT